jgi:hypothetical protein
MMVAQEIKLAVQVTKREQNKLHALVNSLTPLGEGILGHPTSSSKILMPGCAIVLPPSERFAYDLTFDGGSFTFTPNPNKPNPSETQFIDFVGISCSIEDGKVIAMDRKTVTTTNNGGAVILSEEHVSPMDNTTETTPSGISYTYVIPTTNGPIELRGSLQEALLRCASEDVVVSVAPKI